MPSAMPRSRQRDCLSATPVGAVHSPAGSLQRMRRIEHHWRHLLHHVHPEHIDDKIVVTEGRTSFAQNDAIIASFPALCNDVAHFVRRQKLRFLDIDHCSGSRHGDDQIRLPGEKGRQLDDISDFGGRVAA